MVDNNGIYDDIVELLDKVNRKEGLQILGKILDHEYDLRVASNLAKEDCESSLSKIMFEDRFFSEGNEDAGFIDLKTILKAVEEVVNCDDYISANISFDCFVRPETPEESEDEGHSNSIEWWTKDESIEINNLYLGFQS